jgi:transposase-like protein
MPQKQTTPAKKKRIIELLLEGYSVAAAAITVGITRKQAYNWYNGDKKFAEKWDNAYETGVDILEDVARARAIEKSDAMLTLLLKCRRPKVWNPPPPVPEPVVSTLEFKLTTVREAEARVIAFGGQPRMIEGDYEVED